MAQTELWGSPSSTDRWPKRVTGSWAASEEADTARLRSRKPSWKRLSGAVLLFIGWLEA